MCRKQNEIQAAELQADISGGIEKFTSGQLNSRNVKGIQRQATKMIKSQDSVTPADRVAQTGQSQSPHSAHGR